MPSWVIKGSTSCCCAKRKATKIIIRMIMRPASVELEQGTSAYPAQKTEAEYLSLPRTENWGSIPQPTLYRKQAECPSLPRTENSSIKWTNSIQKTDVSNRKTNSLYKVLTTPFSVFVVIYSLFFCLLSYNGAQTFNQPTNQPQAFLPFAVSCSSCHIIN